MSDLFIRHAEICKTFSNPKRLEIIDSLRDNVELTASDLLEKIDISKPNLSQHMAVLVGKGVVKARRDGLNVHYQLSDKRITQACDIMREVLLSNLEAQAKAIKKITK